MRDLDKPLFALLLSGSAVYLYFATGIAYGARGWAHGAKAVGLTLVVGAMISIYRFSIFLITLNTTPRPDLRMGRQAARRLSGAVAIEHAVTREAEAPQRHGAGHADSPPCAESLSAGRMQGGSARHTAPLRGQGPRRHREGGP
jgi:hypothetical protein